MELKESMFFHSDDKYNKVWEKREFGVVNNNVEATHGELSRIGVKRVRLLDSLGYNIDYQDKLTLLVAPLFSDVEELNEEDEKALLQRKRIEYSSLLLTNGIKTEEPVISDDLFTYYKLKNLIVANINIFSRQGLIYHLEAFIRVNNIQFISKEDINKLRLENVYITRYHKRIEQLKKEITERLESIKNLEEMYFEDVKKVDMDKQTLTILENNQEDIGTKFTRELEAIKELPIVEQVEIKDNLEITFTPISIKGLVKTGTKVEEGIEVPVMENKLVPIGRLKFIIKEDNIKVKNLDLEEEYPHPHSSGGSICFGEASLKVKELLATFELKKLTQLLYSWSVSYNEGDCYKSLTAFYNEEYEDDE